MSYDESKKAPFPSRRDVLKGGTASLLATIAAPLLFSMSPARTSAGSGRKYLTLFYSRTDNTRAVARYIHGRVGGDILEIKTVAPYSSDYTTATRDARRELLTGVRTPIQPLGVDIASYDVIFLGSPRWWGTLSMPILDFVLNNDLSGKTIAPFNTHGGGSQEKTFEDLALLCPKANLLDGLSLTGNRAQSSQDEIYDWLRKNGMG